MFYNATQFRTQLFATVAALIVSAAFVSAAVGPIVPLA